MKGNENTKKESNPAGDETREIARCTQKQIVLYIADAKQTNFTFRENTSAKLPRASATMII